MGSPMHFWAKNSEVDPSRPDLFRGGIADYAAMARAPSFKSGLDRLLTDATTTELRWSAPNAIRCTATAACWSGDSSPASA